ncbi:MAG: glycosyltransferase family 9 protein [Sphingobacteriaceae bacterium]|nr:glycosyltransferase family 9 protein [Sphingobacteriaceae bacterium]
MKKHENNLIVIHGGIGDVLLWVPTLKDLIVKPDILLINDTPELEILKKNNLVHEILKVNSKLQWILFSWKNRKKYNNIFLNHLCGGKLILFFLKKCGDTVITNSKNISSRSGNLIIKNPEPNIHDASQNYLLVLGKTPKLNQNHFSLVPSQSSEKLVKNYFCIHLCAGNAKTPYKNWPVHHWKTFLESLQIKYPDKDFVFLGGKGEEIVFNQLNLNPQKFISLIGKTSLNELDGILKGAELFIGPDGGLMHLAFALGLKSFVIWGASSSVYYSYEQVEKVDYKIVKLNLNCMPCNAWLNPNKSKASNPLLCPDFKCLNDLKPDFVLSELEKFM